ncbi:MAG: sigma-54 dependent transcriptional regulator [Desulfovibrionaceae bacterium]|nr:sigma-54 dependent transcriptional regulator [Desulfovibrionaceae bacterium]
MALFLTVGLDADARDSLATLADAMGHHVAHSDDYEYCARLVNGQDCSIVISYLNSGRKDQWPLLRSLPHLPGSPDIMAVVEENDTGAAEYAVQSGFWDILYLPLSIKSAKISLNRCLYHRLALSAQDNTSKIKRDRIIGGSPLLERCLRQMHIVAQSDSNVLVLGETGTGKELFAKAVHENSGRARHPLIVVDCTNLPATLAESILFGHARGSFTGAVEATDGLFKQADKGTIFLDEIGELDLNIQKSLLRVIQERRFRPLSAKKEVECDFRIIAATNMDLDVMVQEGKFRADLYHRINTRTIILPSLRERQEDIPQLAEHYAKLFCSNLNCGPKEIDDETLDALRLYPWPGNIRELVNIIHATVLNGIAENRLYPQHLPGEIRLFLIRSKGGPHAPVAGSVRPGRQDHALQRPEPDRKPAPAAASPKAGDNAPPLKSGSRFSFQHYSQLPAIKEVREEIVRQMEQDYLRELIQRCQGNFNSAQSISGLSRARLYELLQKHELSV